MIRVPFVFSEKVSSSFYKREDDDGRPRRNIMRSFKINEISAVDRPAQQGAVVAIMKRRGDPNYNPKNPDRSKRGRDETGDIEKRAMLTGVTNDHSHLLVLDPETGEGARPAGNTMPALSPGADFPHTHPWVMQDDGEIVIGMADGHDHEPGEISTTRMRASELLMEKQDDEAAESGGRRRRRRNQMTDDAKKAAEAHEAEKKDLEKKLAKAEAYGKLSDSEKAHYGKLDDAEKDAFLAKSEDERAEIVKAAAKAAADGNPVVYKASDGSEYRKNDDPRLIALAKQSDERLASLEKAHKDSAEASLKKRAEEDLANLPGTVETRIALLKQVDAIPDEKARAEALAALKAHNAQMAKSFVVHGTRGTVESESEGLASRKDAEAELEKRAKDLQKSDAKLSYVDAYTKVAEQNPDLYAKAVAG
jgi:hypothetical protein